MIDGKRVCVVMPAYNASKTLERTYAEIDRRLVDDVLVVDDASGDDTALVARRLGLPCIVHPRNRGYGGNQKTCYREALLRGADIVVMLHPDYQYSPRLLPALTAMIASGHFDVALGSRILGVGALAGGMPYWKYVANRALTFAENLLLGHKLAEYHTGYRAFSRRVLEALPLEHNSDDFVFDNQMLAQAIWAGFAVGEVSCPARYFADASSINFSRSVQYGLGVLGTALEFRLARWGLVRSDRFARRLPGATTWDPFALSVTPEARGRSAALRPTGGESSSRTHDAEARVRRVAAGRPPPIPGAGEDGAGTRVH